MPAGSAGWVGRLRGCRGRGYPWRTGRPIAWPGRGAVERLPGRRDQTADGRASL